MRKTKENIQGITLIALVVTIVVLIILAAISIGALSGGNGIINKSQSAKEETEIAKEKETVEISAVQAAGKDQFGNITEDNLAEELTNNIGKRDVDYTLEKEGESFIVTYIDSNRSYLVDADGNIMETVKREGLKVGDYVNYIPDENSSLRQDIEKGSEVEILEEAGEWFLVRNFAGVEGWIKKENIPEVKKFW